MQILTIAGYKFTSLDERDQLRTDFFQICRTLALKGTILLSKEGINLNLAGNATNITSFKQYLKKDPRFTDMVFHELFSDNIPFQHLKIKLKQEIITLRQPEVDAVTHRAPHLSPTVFKQWLDEKRDITVLDTRNDYEVRFGTFKGAIHLQLTDFSKFPAAIHRSLQNSSLKNKPIVMFCTGGIRCEKAALHLINQGFSDVYQLDGGILGYFATVGSTHYEGECFVFDERTSVDANLKETGTAQCRACHGPVSKEQQQLSTYMKGVSCPTCA